MREYDEDYLNNKSYDWITKVVRSYDYKSCQSDKNKRYFCFVWVKTKYITLTIYIK